MLKSNNYFREIRLTALSPRSTSLKWHNLVFEADILDDIYVYRFVTEARAEVSLLPFLICELI